MLAQHLYESALHGDHAQKLHKSRHVEDEVSLLSTSSAANADSHIGNTSSNDEDAFSFVGNRRINVSNRRTSTRVVVGIVLALMLALAILLDVAERHVHVSNFRRHGRTIQYHHIDSIETPPKKRTEAGSSISRPKKKNQTSNIEI